MDVKIIDVFTPSEAQTKKNIFGNVNLEIVSADGTLVARLTGIALRKTKSQDYFLSMPSYEFTKDGEKQYRKHFDIFPFKAGEDNKDFNNKQKERTKALTDEVVRIVSKGGTKRQNQQGAPTPTSSAPAAKPSREPWG